MQPDYFLFAVAFIWTIFATVQDLKTREVANWLNFSLIAVALSYRAFYASTTNNIHFFLLGLLGFGIFVAISYAFYYGKVFAGGDAKLLMGYGAIIPFESYSSVYLWVLLTVILLLCAGAAYSLIYSLFIIKKQKKKFSQHAKKTIKKYKLFLALSLALFIVSIFAAFYFPASLVLTILSIIPWAYVYTTSLDKCMIQLVKPNKLTEGDWIENDIKINSKTTIEKTIHGLSFEDIQLLKKYNKSVLIKQGIPFTPAFVITLLALFYLFSKNINLISVLTGVY